MQSFAEEIRAGIPGTIPAIPPSIQGVNHAPARPDILTPSERELALKTRSGTSRRSGTLPLLPNSPVSSEPTAG